LSNRARRLWLAMGLFASAALIQFAWSFYGERRTNILALPLDLEVGRTVSSPFHVLANADYWVEFAVDRKGTFHETECLAGVGMAPTSTASALPTNCPPGFQAPKVDWVIVSDGHPLPCSYKFPPGTGGYGPEVDRELCVVTMKPGASYVAQVWIHDVALPLRSLHPRLQVIAAPMDTESGVVFSVIPFGISVALVIFGVVQVIRAFLSRAKPPRPKAGMPSDR